MRKRKLIKTLVTAGAGLTCLHSAHGQTVDQLLNKLEQKGVLTEQDANELKAEAAQDQTNAANSTLASKIKIADTIKSMQIYGDFRLRYEYRGVDNVPGASAYTYYRERFRYALRFGIRGDLFDNFNYGIRLETSTNPRSPWATFGNNTTAGSATPSDKSQSGINIGQAFLGWHPASWYEMSVGRMPQPLYTTPMVWDSDINPEGAFEKFKLPVRNVDLFADFGQWCYQDPNPASDFPSSDTFLLTWQAGANVHLGNSMSFKFAPMFYSYSGINTANNGLNLPFVGQGNAAGGNPGIPGSTAGNLAAFNQDGLDNLRVLEIPAEFNFDIANSPLGPLHARVFGDFGYNLKGDDRADAAYAANPAAFPGLTGPVHGQDKAYQAGVGIGSGGAVYGPTQGLVYGSTSKKGTWEARAYYQHIEQYALDVNLIDSDFFEGRANLEGFYTAVAYSFTDAIIGTIRYGYADRIKSDLGTGGSNLDIPGINPIKNYNLLQMDLTWRF